MPVESMYQEAFEEIHRESNPAIDQWRQSVRNVTLESYLSHHRHTHTSSPHRNSRSTPSTAGTSDPKYNPPEEALFTSPMDHIPQAVYEPSGTNDGNLDPLRISNPNSTRSDSVEESVSTESAPHYGDTAWAAGTAPRSPYSSSVNHVPNALRYAIIHFLEHIFLTHFISIGPVGRL